MEGNIPGEMTARQHTRECGGLRPRDFKTWHAALVCTGLAAGRSASSPAAKHASAQAAAGTYAAAQGLAPRASHAITARSAYVPRRGRRRLPRPRRPCQRCPSRAACSSVEARRSRWRPRRGRPPCLAFRATRRARDPLPGAFTHRCRLGASTGNACQQGLAVDREPHGVF